MLEIRGMIFADATRDADVEGVMQRLDAVAGAVAGARSAAAIRAGHFVRAYSARQHSQFAVAEDELKHIDINSVPSDSERYRVLTLRGHVLRILGQDEAALPFLEQALDLANKMRDEPRILHAMLALARIYTDSGNFDRAMLQLDSARSLATRLGDESALVELKSARQTSRTAAGTGPRRGGHRWPHWACETLGKQQMAGIGPVNLGDSYLKTRDFNESLKYFQTGHAHHVAHQSAQ